jgi:hypothetical protein
MRLLVSVSMILAPVAMEVRHRTILSPASPVSYDHRHPTSLLASASMAAERVALDCHHRTKSVAESSPISYPSIVPRHHPTSPLASVLMMLEPVAMAVPHRTMM